MSLRSRILRAGAWTLGSYSIELATRLVSNVIMTRLLFPEAFGQIAASTSIIVGLGLISDFGVHAAIIQSARGDEDDFLRSAWTFQVYRGFLLWFAVIVLSSISLLPIVHGLFAKDSVFSQKSFAMITIALGFQLVLSGLESTALSLNFRRLNFRPVVVVDLAGKLGALPIMIVCAISLENVWALVCGGISASLIRLFMSHFYVPGPTMRINRRLDHLNELFHFGKWITVSSIATFITSQLDIMVFGIILHSSFLGIYFLAKGLIGATEGLLEKLNSSMTLSVMGEVLRNKPAELRNRYYRFRLPLESIAAPAAGFVFATAHVIVATLYDHRYSEAGTMLQILSFGLALYPFQLIRSAFTAIGRTDIVAKTSIAEAASMIVLLFCGYAAFGPLGAVMGVAINRTVPSIIMMYRAHSKGWL